MEDAIVWAFFPLVCVVARRTPVGYLDASVTAREAGEALMVPAKAIHAVKNVGSDGGAVLATYVVEKGKPLITLAE